MYLSRVEINRQRLETKQALMNFQIMHAAVLSCFPSSRGRVLWRIDTIQSSTYVLLVSEIKPDFTAFIQQFGWPASGQLGETKEYEPFLQRIEAESIWRFRLTANPVRNINFREEHRDKRGKIASLSAEEQKKWLAVRAEAHGFRLPEVSYTNAEGDEIKEYSHKIVARETKRFRRQGKTVTISVATFEGILTVTDTELFTQTLRNGIGRAKAYGCGLLTIVKDHE
jgi:CRISPR system Cascade subunit CasE